jgi:hypothetical protein
MKLLFDDDLVEAVVFLCATGRRPGVPPLLVRRFHAERERCYATADPDERAAAFARVNLGWFSEWGLEDFLSNVLRQFPLLADHLAALAFRKSRSRYDEGAELYCDAEGRRRGIVALRPERFGNDTALGGFLNHELAQLVDMLDERFGFAPELALTGQTASQQRLVRERYRLLWSVSIDGRLTERGLPTVAAESQRRSEFNRGFAFLPEARQAELFAALWSGRLVRHDALLEIAADPRGLRERHAPVPGAPCPLCGFAAFQWTEAPALRSAALARIRAEFPGWHEDAAICARCAEMYDAIAGLEYPATVCL